MCVSSRLGLKDQKCVNACMGKNFLKNYSFVRFSKWRKNLITIMIECTIGSHLRAKKRYHRSEKASNQAVNGKYTILPIPDTLVDFVVPKI